MEDFAVGKPGQEKGADACGHALKRVPRGDWELVEGKESIMVVSCHPFYPVLRE